MQAGTDLTSQSRSLLLGIWAAEGGLVRPAARIVILEIG
jgi:hypothetical protein